MCVRKVCAAAAAAVVLVSGSDAFAASNKDNWATAGKVLTGVAAVSVVATLLNSGNSDRESSRDRDRDDGHRGRERRYRGYHGYHDRWHPYPAREVVYYPQPVYRTVVVERPAPVTTTTTTTTTYGYGYGAPVVRDVSTVYWAE